MIWRLSRLRCRLFDHHWVSVYGHPLPFAPMTLGEICDRPACRGRGDAIRWFR